MVCPDLVHTALVATVNAFLTVGFLVLLGQAHDELNGEFIVATEEELDASVATLSVFCEAWYAGRPAKSPRLAKIAHHGYPY